MYGLPLAQWQRIRLLMQKTWIQCLGWKDPLEEEMANHSSNLAWKIPWTKKPGRLQSKGLQESDTTKRLSTEGHILKGSPNIVWEISEGLLKKQHLGQDLHHG